ncbi:hypothetical protein [Chengkuizengella axinellae]|uniref:Uncharacterized protein n=1 Tax=Chengkuizengella axinellae TaxID=3064388 RepID=A0ABT9J3G0_9BACL|nr:hypothetical protein [Chengkuizengella sp. 2205SS18-9]MDP5276157.1 hypothetical protein [Chengkuizengella sp. 2205SS18-9]
MGIESYNFIVFPKNNHTSLTEDGWEIIGTSLISFKKITEYLLSFKNITNYEPENMASYASKDCYYNYVDETSIIEFEINYGDKVDFIQEISARFAVCNGNGTYEKFISICKSLNRDLNLETLDMKFGEILDFDDELQILRSKNTYEKKKKQFYRFFKLPNDSISRPVHCGKAVFDLLL